MADTTLASLTGETLLKVALPIVAFALWALSVRLRTLHGVLVKYPFTRAIIEVALVLAGAWSLGTAAEALRDALVPDQALAQPGVLVRLAMYLAVSFSVGRLVEAAAVSRAHRGHGDGLSRLSRTFLYGVCLLAGLLVFFAANDFPRLTVVTGGFAAVLAFALRQTLTDVVAGVALGIERPFRRRDWVMLEDGSVAEVIDMDWRATHLRGWDRAIFLVPNAQLARQTLRVLPKPGELYADTFTILVSGDEDPERVKSLLEEAARKCEALLSRPAPVIRLADASSLPYRYSLWVHFDGYMASFAGREELFSNIHKALSEAGLQVTAEVQDIRFERKRSESRP
ncbi:mechanosensitive ion channel family protein [Defluviimonas sp. WL0024]|uniref:Mechanosensitive ion channel family protein n=1 Tax=Albidovulum salinarum TaxID=2984153 RepID=A0ABT2WYH3_9RHOB|nr:mechanosensitive ion channel family protein [Defluviimonas sp. WL0024]MCU9846733.1 mechanosensitive ion channel family protein [Defluviimonas sp. WL0024]